MPLTVLEVQKAKPREKQYKMSDGQGLYLLVDTKGRKYWRMKYYFANRERVYSIGVFPDVSLALARQRREDVRRMKMDNIDPMERKREKHREFIAAHENTFEKVAREWHETKKSRWSEYYAKQIMQRLELDVFPRIGSRLTNKLMPSDLLVVARAIEKRDAVEMAHRAMQICGQIFQFAIITDRATQNPTIALRGALRTAERRHRAHLESKDMPEFLGKLEAYQNSLQSKLALKLLMLTFVRPVELCGARWEEIDLTRKEWRIPGPRMKMRTPHIVPLSTQALEILVTLRKLNPEHEFVFPGGYTYKTRNKPISTNALLFLVPFYGIKIEPAILEVLHCSRIPSAY